MTFYSSDDAEIDAKGLQVYLAEVDFTTLPDKYAKAENGVVVLYDVADKIVTNTSTATDFTAVKVYDGDYDFGSGANVITFDTQYTYNGGDLLVIVQNTSGGTKYSEKSFYGKWSLAEGVSRYKYYYPGSDFSYPATFLAKCTFGYVDEHTYTVTWKNFDGETLETDTNVLPGTAPEFNGNITVPEGDTLYWSDGTNMYKADELPLVTRNVTYTAVIKAVKTLAVGTVFTLDDAVIFGEDNYFNDWNDDGRVGLNNGIGTAVFGEPEYNSYRHLYLIVDTKTHISLGVNSPKLNEAFSVKCIAGDGTEQKPFLFRLIPESGENSFKVVCESSGKYVYDIYAARGTAISAPGAPDSTPGSDYVFAGWCDENGRLFDFSTPITKDTFLTAKWVKGAALTGTNLILGDDIGVNFYMELSPSVAGSDTAKMIFTIPDNGSTSTVEMPVKSASCVELDGKTYYIFPCHVAAKEMTSTIKAQIVNGSDKGTVFEYSVKQYADYIIAHPDKYGDEAVDLVKSMLYYGSTAQTLFNFNTNAPAGADLGDYTLIDVPESFAQCGLSNVNEKANVAGLQLTNVSLVLESKTTLRLYFKRTDPTSSDDLPALICGDTYIEPQQKEGQGTDGEYYYDIKGFAPGEVFEKKDVNIDGGESFELCIGDYCNMAMNSGNDKLKATITALYNYEECAKAYKEAQGGSSN